MLRAGGSAARPVPRVAADALRLPFRSARFDVVTAGLMVGDVADLEAWAAEMWRVLAPGGRLVYSDFHESWIARGFRRTFADADGRRYELPLVPRATGLHVVVLGRLGFTRIVTRIVGVAASSLRGDSISRVLAVEWRLEASAARSSRWSAKASAERTDQRRAASGERAEGADVPICTVFAADRPHEAGTAADEGDGAGRRGRRA
jgi:SAM-dependent methyltransferase